MSDEITTFDPYTLKKLKSYPIISEAQLEESIKKSKIAFSEWKQSKLSERSVLLKKTAEVLNIRARDLAVLCSQEMGKPINESLSEVKKCASVCEYYADNLESFLQDKQLESNNGSQAFVSYQPIGGVLAVMPWNFPYWQAFRFLAPTLACGNVAFLKHASIVTGCALMIEEVLLEAGFPEGVFQTLVIKSKTVEELIANKFIQGVSFTGSTDVGKKIGMWAGMNLKRSVLELGGSDPYIIAEDADLPKSLRLVFKSRLINGGQSCIAAKRLFVHESQFEQTVEVLKDLSAKVTFGDPQDESTTMGPLSKTQFKKELDEQINLAKEHGAKLEVLKTPPDEMSDVAYPVSLLTNITKKNPIYKQEIFGPVLCLYTYKNIEEAFEIANDTSFGLGGAVFTKDIELGKLMATQKINSGSVSVNDFVRSHPAQPFGGVKESGYGRELSENGIYEFVNIKCINIKK